MATTVNILFFSLLESAVAFRLLPNVFPFHTLTGALAMIFFINLGACSIYRLFIYPFLLDPLRHLPKPASGFIPILGHALSLHKQPMGSTQLQAIKKTPNDGIILARGFFHEPRLIPTKPTVLAEILVQKSYDFEKPPWVRTFLRQFLGDGLLMTEGDEHRRQRKQIIPAFHFRHIKELYPVFWNKSIELCRIVQADLRETPGKIIDLTHFSTQVTLDIIGLAGLGRDIGSLRNSDDELVQNYEEILEPTTEKLVYFLLHLLFPAWIIKALPWKLNERVRTTTSNLKRICIDFVKEKGMRIKTENEESLDILSIMIRSQTFSDEGLVDQLLTFLAAGHETTSSALTWATHLLAKNPSAQTRLRAEIHDRIPDPNALSEPGYNIAGLLESMPYLNAVCNETLRLYPTIPLTSRAANKDTTVNGQFIPRGTIFVLSPWATNRDPSLWGADSEKFLPDRWLDLETGRANYIGGADSNYSFLTFLHGPRSCIGEKFARSELRALVAAFVGSFDIEMENSNEDIKVGGTVTSKPVGGMKLKLRPVEW